MSSITTDSSTTVETLGIDAEGFTIVETSIADGESSSLLIRSRLTRCCSAAPTGSAAGLICKDCCEPVGDELADYPAEPIVPIAEHELAEQLARFWETRGNEAVTS